MATPTAASADLGSLVPTRYGGTDRYETSLLVADAVATEAGDSLSSVVLVSGERWTDAVVAAPIAGSLGTPVLMTPPGELRADALEFLQRTGVTAAVVVGPEVGGGAHGAGRGVSAAVLSALARAGITAERVAGTDRFGTSVEAARKVTPGVMSGLGPTAIVASAEVFADALVAGPFAARGIHPVLLSGPDALPAEVASYLDTSSVSHVVVMGGTGALSARVEMAIEALDVEVTRLAGATRYDTAVKAAELVTGRYDTARAEACFATSTIGLARARVPFDSFSAAPLLGRLCAPLVLADPTQIPTDTAAFLDTAREANATVDLRVFGGNAAVSQAAINAYLAGNDGNKSDDDDDSDASQAVPVGLPAGTCGGSINDEPSALLDSSDAEDPAWSPDCSEIVYSYRGSLWTMDNDGTNRQRLTAYDGSYSNEPAWSPDGNRIAYRRGHRNGDGHWISHIHVVNADGTGSSQVTTGDVWDGQPSWLPDGSRIAFASRSGEGRDENGNFVTSTQYIVTVNADGTGRSVLTTGGRWHGSPAWSPDGDRIAYVSEGVVWLIDPDGSDVERVIGGAFSEGGLAWSPDGRRIAFVRGDWDEASIIMVGLDGYNEQVVTHLGGFNAIPRWSPDGDRIAFTHYPNGRLGRDRSAYVTGASGTPTGIGGGCRPRGVSHPTTAGFPLPAHATPAVGTVRVAVLFVDFPDAQAAHTTEEEAALGLSWAEDYLEAASYGKLDLEYVPLHGWLRAPNSYRTYLSESVTGYDAVRGGFFADAVALADDRVDFSEFHSVAVVLPSSHFFGGSAGRLVEVDGVSLPSHLNLDLPLDEPRNPADWGLVGAHELAHNLGLPDLRPGFGPGGAYARSTAPDGEQWISANFGPMNLLSWFPASRNDRRLQHERSRSDGSTQQGYVGHVHALEMLAWSRWQLGWIGNSQMRCVEDGDSEATVTLAPVAQPGEGVAMAAIQISSHEVVVVESRRKLGYDLGHKTSSTRAWSNDGVGILEALIEEGVLVYTVDTLFGSNQIPTRVAGDNGRFEFDDFPVLQAGESVTVAGYTITVTADDGDTHTVTIAKAN
ncbi:cell wall-binding repeat-containing protein [Candidatus Poriferisodalis sp.]|uniref:cell wall-binding repeat-containing protein n=1 Tax=Candidatus Poriferisodalis sp. TaxID=3101277 RepID=UPI003B02B404